MQKYEVQITKLARSKETDQISESTIPSEASEQENTNEEMFGEIEYEGKLVITPEQERRLDTLGIGEPWEIKRTKAEKDI